MHLPRFFPRAVPALASLVALALAGCREAPGDAGTPDAPGAASASLASVLGGSSPSTVPASSATPPASSAVADPGTDAAAAATPPPPLPEEELYPTTLEAQREALYRRMTAVLRLDDQKLSAVRAIFARSKVLGQGNPALAKYAMTRRECREARERAGVVDADKPVCGAPNMVPLYDPAAGQTEADARACIDRYEFPNIPCEHPVVWATAREAAELCTAVGKRLCDAHEWEGGCAGALHAPEDEYAFGKERKISRHRHNDKREITWAYGSEKNHARCATASRKTKGCTSGGWRRCGTNAYPSGAFPGCVSPLGVYDQHGNVAEHMNLPTRPQELTSAGGMGYTEMKGSWFIFSGFEAHPDDCRWRAPDWHATKIKDHNSHGNYHLGFRCCASVTSSE
ncbi:SUMF1/EgtB/PvdO family nonheme iron enzyme [Chondromyces crocatus]|nr:SUMF1/EgtB/PvdO family nonheme iron enzyme [Chondromyces crocatus]